MQVRFRQHGISARLPVPTTLIRITTCAALLLTVFLCATTASDARTPQARANDAVALENADSSDEQSASPASTETRLADDGHAADASGPSTERSVDTLDHAALQANDDHSQQSERYAPQQEAQPLGKPRRLLGNRGISGKSNTDASGAPDELRNDDQSTAFSALRGEIHHIIQVVGALLVVVALILLTRFVLLRSSGIFGGAGRPSGVLEILARFPIARGQSLVLIKMARRIVLVHQTSASMTTLSEVTEQDEVASLLRRIEAGANGRDQHRFKNILEQFQRDHKRIDRRDPSRMASEQDNEIIDLTRRQSGGLGRLFGGAR